MRLALLNRRLLTLAALASLGAFAAGSGADRLLVAAALGLAASVVWRPSPVVARRLEQVGWTTAGGIFVVAMYVGLVLNGDYLPLTLGFLLVLLVTEALRPLDAGNDLRLYTLSFAVLIASTAYYPGVPFALAFVAYVGCVTLALMVGHLKRQAERYRVEEIPLRRSFMIATAALSTVAVLSSALVFLAFPRLPRGWIGSNRAAAQSVMVGFGEGVSLGDFGGRIQPNPEVVFRVEFDGPLPPALGSIHWRGRSYDHFDGVRWSRSGDLWSMEPAPLVLESRWPGGTREYQIFGGPPGARVLFGIHPILDVTPRTPMRPVLDATGDITVPRAESPVYRVRSGEERPPAEWLRAAAGPDPSAASWYLQLPALAPRVLALADSLTAGEPTRYDAVLAVERWLNDSFSYTLDLPASRREATLEHFLFSRREGHCEYFSTAMAILLRAAGIPARNVTGFMGGEWHASARYLAVTQNDAHSWVEVWFPELGWVAFDPTPAASRNQLAGAAANTSFVWPVLFWWDGLQHRWTRWVLFYDLDKQLRLMRHVSDLLAPSGAWARPGGRWPSELRQGAPWLLALAGIGALVWLGRRRTGAGASLGAGSRAYLALRRAYRRAGYGDDAAPPALFLESLRVQEAPGVEHAGRAIDLYLRTRFGAEALGAEQLREIRTEVRSARRAVRRERRSGAGTGRGREGVREVGERRRRVPVRN
jgi:protein-glutamine gamma-glutamyltransferase